MRNFEQAEFRPLLREIERHLVEWESQQAPEQRVWVAQARRRNHLSTRAGAQAIVEALRL
jgi:hypothetical protein